MVARKLLHASVVDRSVENLSFRVNNITDAIFLVYWEQREFEGFGLWDAFFHASAPDENFILSTVKGRTTDSSSEEVVIPPHQPFFAASFPIAPGTRKMYIDFSTLFFRMLDVEGPRRGTGLFHVMEALEALREHPHPNIEIYRGCVLAGPGFLREVHTERAGYSLKMTMRRGFDVDTRVVIYDCWQAINHLHRLGWIHNNICPSTIMVTADGRGVLTNFSKCRAEGQKISVCSPFSKPRMDLANQTNDIFSIQMCERWISEMKKGTCKWTLEDDLELMVEEAEWVFDNLESNFIDSIDVSVFK